MMSQRTDLIHRVADAISREQWTGRGVTARELASAALVAIASAEDWHILSSAEVTREDHPPIPDYALDDGTRYSLREPQRVTTIRAELDTESITARGHLNRHLLNVAADTGYLDHADRTLGLDFLQLLGHRLGVPGCEDLPERLAKAGHP